MVQSLKFLVIEPKQPGYPGPGYSPLELFWPSSRRLHRCAMNCFWTSACAFLAWSIVLECATNWV